MPGMAATAQLVTVLWWLVLALGVVISLVQVEEMLRSWREKPFTYYSEEEAKVAKHRISFPTVTVCGEGATLWPALEVFMEGQQVEAGGMRSTVAAHLRMVAQEVGWTEDQHVVSKDSYLEDMCLDDSELCKFVVLVTAILDSKFSSEGVFTQAPMVEEIKDMMKGEDGSEEVTFQANTEWSYAEGLFSQYEHQTDYQRHDTRNNIIQDPDLIAGDKLAVVQQYLYLKLLMVINQKAEDFEMSLIPAFLSSLGSSPPVANTRLHCAKKPQYTFCECAQPSGAPNLTLGWEDLLANTSFKFDLCQVSHSWNSYYKTVDASFLTATLRAFLRLRAMEGVDIEGGASSILLSVQSRKDLWSRLPPSLIFSLTEEVDKVTNNLVKAELGIPNVPWSVKDTLDIILTTGAGIIKQKASWATFKRDFQSAYSTGGGGQRKLSFTKLLAKEKLPPNSYWTSLSKDDQLCLMETTMDHQRCTKTVNYLQEIKDALLVSQQLKQLVEATSHPPSFSNPDQRRTWTIPFCWVGNKLNQLSRQWVEKENYPFKEDLPFYGYEFCSSANTAPLI